MSDGVRYYGQASCLKPSSVRQHMKVLISAAPLLAGAAPGWHETLTPAECRMRPWVAQFVLRCPTCRLCWWVTGRGTARHHAVNTMLANVAAHVIACEGSDEG